MVTNAQKIDSIFVNLYTDSLKKGTYNYINVDGLYSNGRYLPLDTSDVSFTSSEGTFYGNSLFIEPDFTKEKVSISVVLKKNPGLRKDFDIYIKKIENTERLKTTEEILQELRNKPKSKNKG